MSSAGRASAGADSNPSPEAGVEVNADDPGVPHDPPGPDVPERYSRDLAPEAPNMIATPAPVEESGIEDDPDPSGTAETGAGEPD